MKSIFLSVSFGLICVSILSCSKNDNVPAIPEVDPVKTDTKVGYVFLKKEVVDFKAYQGGSTGGIDITATSEPGTFWNSTKLQDGYFDTLTVFKDSISERPYKYEKNDFKFKISNDTIYQWNRYASFWQLYGRSKGDTLEHFMSFYSLTKVTPPDLYSENGHNDGLVNATRYFNDNKYLFKDISSMKNKNDEVAWYNIKYVYVKKK